MSVKTKAALRRAFYACVYCMWLRFQRKLRWLPQTKVITLKTQLRAVNARWKRLSRLSFSYFQMHLKQCLKKQKSKHGTLWHVTPLPRVSRIFWVAPTSLKFDDVDDDFIVYRTGVYFLANKLIYFPNSILFRLFSSTD